MFALLRGFILQSFCWPPAFFHNWLQGQLLGIINKRYSLPRLCHGDCTSKIHKLWAKICASPWGQGSACRVHVWGSFQGHGGRNFSRAGWWPGWAAATLRIGEPTSPGLLWIPPLVLTFFFEGFGKIDFFPPSLSMQTKGWSGVCLWHSWVCLVCVSAASVSGAFSPDQAFWCSALH